MKKRLACLFICLCILVPTLMMSACSVKTVTELSSTKSSNKAITVTLYSITGETTTPEAIAAVEEALNEITQRDFNTNVILKLYTEDVYYDVIEEKLETIEGQLLLEDLKADSAKVAKKAIKEAGVTTAKETESTGEESDETEKNLYGVNQVIYPDENGTQFDIFLVNDKEYFEDYIEREMLYGLSGDITTTYSILTDYIHPQFFNVATRTGEIYGVPNNHVMGTYQYILVNKELVEKYSYEASDLSNLANLQDFLLDTIRYEEDYIPIVGEPYSMIQYLPGFEDSLFGSYVAKTAAYGVKANPRNLLGVKLYRNYLSFMKTFTDMDYFHSIEELEEGQKFAVAFMDGYGCIPAQYEDEYHITVHKNPIVYEEDLYAGMYCISSYAKYPDRCMDVIKLLTTNAEYRNIFQYGIKDVNYDVDDETGVIKMKNDTYSMDYRHTGNQFILEPSSDMDPQMIEISENNWELAKQQNLDIVVHPYNGFYWVSMYDEEGNLIVKEEEEVESEVETEAETEVETEAETEAVEVDSETDTTVEGEEPVEGEEASEGEEAEEATEEETKKTPGSRTEKKVYTLEEITEEINRLSEEYLEKIWNFEGYVDEEGKAYTLMEYMELLAEELSNNKIFETALDVEEEDSPITQYATWYLATYT